jgi:TPR repeat protein
MYALYYCGKMYQYENGVGQDFEKAREYLKKAQDLGHPKAEVEYQKVSGWIANNQIKNQSKQQPRDYSSTSTTETVDAGCFITTATCKFLGKPDNCEELLTLKEFRDNYLINESDGPDLIMAYYAIAPEIVSLIEADGDSTVIYQNLYSDYISKSCELIRENKPNAAKKTLIMMTTNLWKKYPVILEDLNLLKTIKYIKEMKTDEQSKD